MPTKVHMEALSPTMEEGQLVRWLKQEGDAVSEGDVLAEIETDKATMELVARGSGVLQGIRVREGQTAPVGEVIAVIAAEGEAVETAEAGEAQPAAAAKATEAQQPAAPAARAARGSEQVASIGETEKPRESEQEHGRMRETPRAESTTARGERAA